MSPEPHDRSKRVLAALVREYIASAIELATRRDALAAKRAYLLGPGQGSALFDTVATTRALEAAYGHMADQCRRGVREPIRIAAG